MDKNYDETFGQLSYNSKIKNNNRGTVKSIMQYKNPEEYYITNN